MFALTSLVLAASWSFSIDGTLSRADFTPLPGGGAVVTVAQVPLLLDEPRRYDFTVVRDAEAGVTRVLERGRLVGVAVVRVESRTSDIDDVLGGGSSASVADVLEGKSSANDTVRTPSTDAAAAPPAFSREELAGLRGFAFIPGAVVPPAMIEQVVPSKACLGVIRSRTLGGGFADSSATEPKVPPGFTCVVLQRTWPVELSSARFLRDDDRVLDAAALLRAQKLESLQLRGTELEWQTLAKLPGLRELIMRWPQKPVDAVPFPRLEVLRIEETVPTDYGALAAPMLQTLVINSRYVTVLPAKLPKLVRGSINAPLVDGAALQAFVTAHAQAKLDLGWRGLLKFDTAGVDGMRVRSGGQVWGVTGSKQLAETRKPEAVAQLLSTLEVDELSAGHCSCGGGPTLQFLKGDFVLAEVTVQHGQALRWESHWPADAELKTDGLAKLLASWGVREPLEEWSSSSSRHEAAAIRRARYAKLLPRSVAPYAMGSSLEDPDLATELKRLEGAGVERVAFYLRLEGTAVEGLEPSPADRLGDAVLGTVKPTELATLAARQDVEVDAGLRQRLFHGAGPMLVSAPALAPHLPRLLLQAMAGPSAEWRRQALQAVAAGKGAGPTAALRAVLASETVGVEERELTALALIKRKDSKSSAAARALCEGKTSAACAEVVRAKAR